MIFFLYFTKYTGVGRNWDSFCGSGTGQDSFTPHKSVSEMERDFFFLREWDGSEKSLLCHALPQSSTWFLRESSLGKNWMCLDIFTTTHMANTIIKLSFVMLIRIDFPLYIF